MKTVISICFLFCLLSYSWAATITAPNEDEQVFAGSWITVVVKPDAGEQWQGFVMGFKAFDFDPASNTYKLDIQIPSDVLGYLNDLRVHGIDRNNNEIELSRRIFVKLPTNVMLSAMEVTPNPLFLEKLSADSPPDDIRVFGTRKLRVLGVYSDGVKRNLTSSANGTTYSSSNEQVVKVDAEGLSIAQDIGKATITVRNGVISADVRVIVDPYVD